MRKSRQVSSSATPTKMATFMNIYISFFLEPICFVLQESRSSHNFSVRDSCSRYPNTIKRFHWCASSGGNIDAGPCTQACEVLDLEFDECRRFASLLDKIQILDNVAWWIYCRKTVAAILLCIFTYKSRNQCIEIPTYSLAPSATILLASAASQLHFESQVASILHTYRVLSFIDSWISPTILPAVISR